MIAERELDRAVAMGIISAEQRAALLGLASGVTSDAATGELLDGGRRGFNAVNVAYWAGGIAVLVAFAWMLIARWAVLGAGGVLGVTAVYAALFALTARTLHRQGFRTASGVATVLVVGMAPVITWSLLSLAGLWDLTPPVRGGNLLPPVNSGWDDLRWLPIDLATILAALIALRRVRYAVLALPIALATFAVAVHSLPLVFEQEMAGLLAPRVGLLVATIVLVVGYAVDIRTRDGEDYAGWFYAVGVFALIPSLLSFWGESRLIVAHATLGISLLLTYAALRMRRRLFLVGALIGFLAYLTYLTFDVFRTELSYPIVLATLGLLTIVLAVWVQRRFPGFARRMDRADRQPIPHAQLVLGGALLVALTLLVFSVPAARQQIVERRQLEAVTRLLSHNQRRRNGPKPVITYSPAAPR